MIAINAEGHHLLLLLHLLGLLVAELRGCLEQELGEAGMLVRALTITLGVRLVQQSASGLVARHRLYEVAHTVV